MGLKEAWDTLWGREVKKLKKAPKFVRSNSQRGNLLTVLALGDWVSPHNAALITNSHKGEHRLREVKRMLENAGIPYLSQEFETPKGTSYRAIKIVSGFQDDVRKLIVGKA